MLTPTIFIVTILSLYGRSIRAKSGLLITVSIAILALIGYYYGYLFPQPDVEAIVSIRQPELKVEVVAEGL